MKRGRILNAELSKAIAMMGHYDILLVCDAGFPVPLDSWRIDLAVTRNIPDHETVLSLIVSELSVEKVLYADLLERHNPPLLGKARRIFAGTGAIFEVVPNDQMLQDIAPRAKAIVRTGAFNPWGNFAIVCGTEPKDWFQEPGTVMPASYVERQERIERGE